MMDDHVNETQSSRLYVWGSRLFWLLIWIVAGIAGLVTGDMLDDRYGKETALAMITGGSICLLLSVLAVSMGLLFLRKRYVEQLKTPES